MAEAHVAESGTEAVVFSLVKVKDGHPNTVTMEVDGKLADFVLPGEAAKMMEWFTQHPIGQITPENALLMFLTQHYRSMGPDGANNLAKLDKALIKLQGKNYAKDFVEEMRQSGLEDFDTIYSKLGITKPVGEEEPALVS